jgi:hypothetical protein
MSQSVSLNHAQPDAADLVAAARHLGAMIRDRRDESERERPSAQRRLVARAAEISLRR